MLAQLASTASPATVAEGVRELIARMAPTTTTATAPASQPVPIWAANMVDVRKELPVDAT